MQEAPLVSIVIPYFNGEQYFGQTISALEKQTYDHIELIIINDGSDPDRHPRQFISPDSRFTIRITDKKNEGVSKARNEGFLQSSGMYVVFLDADDIWDDSWVSEQVRFLNSNKNTDCVGSLIKKTDSKGAFLSSKEYSSYCELRDILEYNTSYISCPSFYMYRRDTLTGKGIFFDEELFSSADKMFLIKNLLKGNKTEVNKAAHGYYRVSGESMSQKLNLPLLLDRVKFIRHVKKYVSEIDKKLMKRFKKKSYSVLAKESVRIKRYDLSIVYIFKYLLS